MGEVVYIPPNWSWDTLRKKYQRASRKGYFKRPPLSKRKNGYGDYFMRTRKDLVPNDSLSKPIEFSYPMQTQSTPYPHIEALKNNDFRVLSYWGYDTGYSSENILYQAKAGESLDGDLFIQDVQRIHREARKLCGLYPMEDNKSAVEIRLAGQEESIYLTLYDFKCSVVSAIQPRLGKQLFPLANETSTV